MKLFQVKTYIFFCLTLFFHPLFSESNWIDLEEMVQDFVLETKKIEIPEFQHPFNPSLVRWKNKILMSFRFRPSPSAIANQTGLIFLDENFQSIDDPKIIELRCIQKWMQDPRLIVIQERLFIVYNDIGIVENPLIRRMLIAEILEENGVYYIENAEPFIYFDEENSAKHEKNWTPFVYQGQMHLIYSFSPLKIFIPHLGTQSCETLQASKNQLQWNWGEIRGGTTALLEEGEYLVFFHSCCKMASQHSNGQLRDHYFMGASTFSASPPFEIKKISPKPIIGKNFYSGPLYKTWKPLHVVFPCGFVSDENFIWIAYGRQDHEAWIVKLDKHKLLESLIPP